MADFHRCNDGRGGVWGGDGASAAKNRKGEADTDDAFHDDAPERGKKMWPL
ncbi:hypothetical protein D3C84_1288330 [compost metagenome]